MAADNELERHQHDWQNFIKMTAYSCIAIAVTLAFMALFLTERSPG